MAAIPSAQRGPLIRTLVSLGLVFALLRTAQTVDIMSGLTKPLVVGVLQLVGVTAADQGGHLLVSHVRVPWTGDCAGLNIFAVLLALTFWANRAEPLDRRFALKLLVAVPLAFAANVGRILTLISYRVLLFPAVESAQLHYFIGFIWLLPFVGFFSPRQQPGAASRLPGMLQIAAALGLVAPHVTGPGGTVVTLCTLLALVQSRFTPPETRRDHLLAFAWMAVAPAIAIARMESLWLPWLLGCPLFLSRNRGWVLTLPLLLLGTIPLAAAHAILQWPILIAAAASGWLHFTTPAAPEIPLLRKPVAAGFGVLVVAVFLVFPFVASSVAGRETGREPPPRGTMTRLVEARASEVRLPGQSRDLGVIWYEPSGDGRHHTLEVCLRYRGMSLTPTPQAAVLTDGKSWFREFFFCGDELVGEYRDYLRRTIWPFSPAGVHLIAVSPQSQMSAEAFAAETEAVARQLQQLRAADRSR